MITINKKLELSFSYPLERIGSPEDLVFFDIETTGLSADRSQVYLIGCVFFQHGDWNLIQWFADRPDSECELLDSFFSFLRRYRILLHFNGDGFDLPYLLKRCRHLNRSWDFSAVESMDIYRKIKPFKKLLGLESLRQKSVEQFLKVARADQYSGGELIEVYHRYLRTHSAALYDLLILHNEDDLKGMPRILPILSYPDLFRQPLSLVRQQVLDDLRSGHPTLHLLELVCQSPVQVPVSIQAEAEGIFLQLENNQALFRVPLYEGTLKQFYPNYKDYYYLTCEDRAVHKSIGEYVNKQARTPATAKTCYTKESGCFLPQFSPVWEPEFRREPKDKLSYASLADVSLSNPGQLQAYTRQLLERLGVKSF